MTHYVCPGCGQHSETPTECKNADCSMMGQALVGCNCEDGLHEPAMNQEVV